MTGALAALLLLAAGPAAAASGSAAHLLAGCPRGCASGNFFHGIGAGGRSRAGFHTIASNPYLLDGLVSSDVLLGIDGRSRAAWLDWRHLGHALYCEDELTAAIGISFPGGVPLSLYAVPAIARRAPRGFRPGLSSAVSIAGTLDIRRGVRVGCAIRAAGNGDPERHEARMLLQLGGDVFTLVVDGALSGPRGRDAQCMLEAWLADGCAIACAYRWNTGELSGGLVVRISRTILDFSWGRHPVLGSTVTAGAGRLWEW